MRVIYCSFLNTTWCFEHYMMFWTSWPICVLKVVVQCYVVADVVDVHIYYIILKFFFVYICISFFFCFHLSYLFIPVNIMSTGLIVVWCKQISLWLFAVPSRRAFAASGVCRILCWRRPEHGEGLPPTYWIPFTLCWWLSIVSQKTLTRSSCVVCVVRGWVLGSPYVTTLVW